MSDISYIYSLEPKLKLSDLKKENFDATDYDVTDISQRMKDQHIGSCVVGKDAHFKFDSIVSKPYVMYTIGDTSLLDRDILAVVGPRKPSAYIQSVMTDVFDHADQYSLVTISGGAPGVDTMCHELSLTHGIPTIMVLGGGFGHYLRSTTRDLIHRVVAGGGLVLSEFRLKQDPTPWTFPQRNRIVAGLADIVFLPGAAKKSGSLITVDFALQMHTPVYSVPASIYEPSSAGTNLYMSTQKIAYATSFEQLFDNHYTKKSVDGSKDGTSSWDLTDAEVAVVSLLRGKGEASIQKLSQLLKSSVHELLVTMMDLEMKGIIREAGVGVWGLK